MTPKFPQIGERQINPAAFGVGADVTQDVGELQRLAEINGIIAARGILIAENLDAQQADNRGDAMAIEFELRESFIALDLQIHLATLDQFIEEREREPEFADDRLELEIHGKLGSFIVAGAANVGAPVGELLAAFFNRNGFFIRHVVHVPAKGVKRGHGVAFGAGQNHKGQCQV